MRCRWCGHAHDESTACGSNNERAGDAVATALEERDADGRTAAVAASKARADRALAALNVVQATFAAAWPVVLERADFFYPARHSGGKSKMARNYPVINGEAEREVTVTLFPERIRERFGKGERTFEVTAAAYILGWVTPAIPWEGGEIVWRATELGKREGIK